MTTWDDRQRAMLAEMGFRLPPVRAAERPVDAPAEARADADVAAASVLARAPASPALDRVTAPAPAAVLAPAPAARALPAGSPAPAGPPTVAPDLSGLDWPGLRGAIAACEACGLCEQRRHAVVGEGAEPGAHWLVVTEPPDDADDASGQPFSTDAGRLLDRMLAAAGQRRAGEAPTAFVTPVVKCRPPRGRAPLPAELQACEAWLARQAELLRPRLVLALGVQAARRLTGLNEPLGRLRGQVHRWRGLPVVVSFHPAYLLRSPADKAHAWDDLRLAMRTLRELPGAAA